MILTQNVLLIVVSRIDGKLEVESAGNEHVARAQQLYSAKKKNKKNKMRRLNQISRTYLFHSTKISI